jgi:hypothetical protein
MIGRISLCLLIIAILHTVSPADAQQTGKIARIGYLGSTSV